MFHKRLLNEFKDNRKMVTAMVVTQWIMLIANVILMFVIADGIRSIFMQDYTIKEAVKIVVILIMVFAVRGIMLYWNSKLSFETSKQLKEKLRSLIYEKLMKIGSKYLNSLKTSEAVQISTEGVEQLEIYFGKYMPQFFYSIIAPITLFIIVATMSIKVAVVLFLVF